MIVASRSFKWSRVLPGRRVQWIGRKGKVKAKYRDPRTKETWSGRGRMASWLKNKQDAR
jgi:DNA-binding protein H-NS